VIKAIVEPNAHSNILWPFLPQKEVQTA